CSWVFTGAIGCLATGRAAILLLMRPRRVHSPLAGWAGPDKEQHRLGFALGRVPRFVTPVLGLDAAGRAAVLPAALVAGDFEEPSAAFALAVSDHVMLAFLTLRGWA